MSYQFNVKTAAHKGRSQYLFMFVYHIHFVLSIVKFSKMSQQLYECATLY